MPDGPAIDYVDVFGELKNAARSPILRCDIPVTRCSQLVAANQAAPPICTVVATVPTARRDRRGKLASTKVRVRLNCDGYKSFPVGQARVRLKGTDKKGKPRFRTVTVKRLIQPRFSVAYKVKGKKREQRLRYLTLPHGKTVSFTCTARSRRATCCRSCTSPIPRRTRSRGCGSAS